MAVSLAESSRSTESSFIDKLTLDVGDKYRRARRSGMPWTPHEEAFHDAIFEIAQAQCLLTRSELVAASAQKLINTLPREDVSKYFKGTTRPWGDFIDKEWVTAGSVLLATSVPYLLALYIYLDIHVKKYTERQQLFERLSISSQESGSLGWELVNSGVRQYQLKLTAGGEQRNVNDMVQEVREVLRLELGCNLGRDRMGSPDQVASGIIYEVDCRVR